jgi:hypothetical protein
MAGMYADYVKDIQYAAFIAKHRFDFASFKG